MTTTPLSLAREEDRQFFQRELDKFVPERVFDAHCHLYSQDIIAFPQKGIPPTVGYQEYVALMRDIVPNRKLGALFIPFFSPDKKEQILPANEFVSRQAAGAANCFGEFFVKPEDDPEYVRQEMKRLKLRGLKCYHTMASARPTWEVQIPDYLPERLIKVADQEGWVITLHMVRSRAVADPGNISWIQRYAQHYPNMKLILAHSARGFQPAHNLEGLSALKGLRNIFFDTSANCEPIAHQAIFRILGHKQVMYGSDLPVSHLRGRSVAAGDSFIWLYENSPVWGEKHQTVKPVLVGLENLRALKWACWSERLSDKAVEDIFWNNAANLFGLK